MKPEYKHKSEESRQREAAHWFGAPNGNKQGEPHAARNQREFYKLEKLYNEENEIDIKDLLTGIGAPKDNEGETDEA